MTINIYSQEAYVNPDLLDLWDDEDYEEAPKQRRSTTNSKKDVEDEQLRTPSSTRSKRLQDKSRDGSLGTPVSIRIVNGPSSSSQKDVHGFEVPDVPMKRRGGEVVNLPIAQQNGVASSAINSIGELVAPLNVSGSIISQIPPLERIGTNAALKKAHPQNTLDFQYRNETYLRPKGSHHLYFAKNRLESSSYYPVKLVPIRIDLDMEGFKFKDTFLWNLYETLLTPEYVAAMLVDDIESPYGAQLVPIIAQTIRAQITDYALAIQDDPLIPQDFPGIENSKIDPSDIYIQYPDPEDVRLAFDSARIRQKVGIPLLEEIKKETVTVDEKEEDEESMENVRIIIKLELNVGAIYLKDQFEWPLFESTALTPEQFARHYTADLGLGGEFTPLVAHAIREQVIMNRLQFDVESRAPDDWVYAANNNTLSTGVSSGGVFSVGSAAAAAAMASDSSRPFRNSYDGDVNAGLSGNAIMNMSRQFPFLDAGNIASSSNGYSSSAWEPEIKFLSEEDIEKIAKEQDRSARRMRRQRQSLASSVRTNNLPKLGSSGSSTSSTSKSSPFAIATAMGAYPETGYTLFSDDSRRSMLQQAHYNESLKQKHEEVSSKKVKLEHEPPAVREGDSSSPGDIISSAPIISEEQKHDARRLDSPSSNGTDGTIVTKEDLSKTTEPFSSLKVANQPVQSFQEPVLVSEFENVFLQRLRRIRS